MSRRLILLNGPPRSGKDSAADILWQHYPNSRRFKMSRPLKDMARAMFNWTPEEADYMEKHKNEPQNALFGWSYRQLQISISEDWAKKQFGADVFGRLAARDLQRSAAPLHICSDSGFVEEVSPLIRVVGTAYTLLVQLSRRGATFEGDSRSYVSIPGVRTVKLENNGSLTDLKEQLVTVVDAWMEA